MNPPNSSRPQGTEQDRSPRRPLVGRLVRAGRAVFVANDPPTTVDGYVTVVCDGARACGGGADRNAIVTSVPIGPEPANVACDAAQKTSFVTKPPARAVDVVSVGLPL